ncbi:SusC/RagA family TonB-linked outer membrane protein [Flavobacterium sp. AED]|uniref:SusC/RagA family TonB-linked outer membrane protein n=1 Tax=Flavobacterium sp. AED TaxID=1423323 RepID=UPI00057EB7EC|nr:SusC/RagA family TonB-linked outer membrane protein [Flavobacterium sp. AED]KIA85338.1 membrane protein [Flavobacterium sp. AED]MDI1307429.1 SusC/RagA family TonB-linked outer membrane protein [bacterium]
MKLKFNGFLVLLVVLVAQLTFAQERSVSGTVSDNAGLPLPGVSVLVKGTKSGTQTDFDGKYSIKATPSQVLVFSYIGMKSQEAAASSSTVNVKLASGALELEGVVVTALGIKREKKSLGYATQEIKAADLTSGAGSGNFINELSGKVAGVSIKRNNNFGGSSSIISRGVKSLTGNNEMLIVIDGMPINNSNVNSSTGSQSGGGGNTYDYGNAAMDINPDDIESINVLKGAAASALYGYLGGNGVVMITTKKGKSKKGLGITISSELVTGSVDKSTFPKYQNKYGAGYGPYYEDASGFFLSRDVNGDGIDDLVVPTSEDASYGAPFDPNKLVYNWNAFTPYSDSYGKATPWQAAKNGPITFFETPLSLSNSISLEDGNETTNFVANFNNYKQNGILPNSELKKNSLSVKINHKFSDKLSISAFANYLAQTTVGRNSTGYNENIMSNFRQWWQTNVDVQELKQVYERSGGQNINWNYSDPDNLTQIYWDNPYFIRNKNYQSDERNRFTGYSKLDYKINDWLTATGKISTDSYSELREERRATGSVAGAFGINRLDETSGYQKYNRTFSEQNYDFILTFKKNFSEDFSFNGVAGGTVVRTRVISTLNSTQGGLIVPGLYSLSNSVASVPFPVEGEVNSGINSYYASTSFGFRDFLFLDATARRDAFSSLPAGSNAIGSYSASGSYVFTKTIDKSWLSFGKVRAGYSESPLGTPGLSLVDTYVKSDPFGTNQQYSVASTKNNPNLQAVKTNTQEVGLEMQFLDRRVGFDVSAYKNVNKGEAFQVPYSTATGNSARYINAATVENKGIEVQFNVTPIKTKDFAWDIFVNWSKNKNTVTKLAEGIENLQLNSFQGGVTLNATVGQPYGVLKGTDFTYLNGQKVVGANGRYVINASTNNVIGDVNPDWMGGVRNKFTYKSLSLGFLIDMKHGGDIFSLDQSYGQATGLYEASAGLNELGNPVRNTIANGGGVILPGVKADGSVNTTRTPAPDQYGNISGYRRAPNKAFVYDASFVKLREVNITYSLPSSLVSRLKLNEMTFSIVGSNLWIISKNLPDADPESGLSSSALSSGYSIGSLPTTKNIGCNVTFKF